jgi:hypothetical protein
VRDAVGNPNAKCLKLLGQEVQQVNSKGGATIPAKEIAKQAKEPRKWIERRKPKLSVA